MKITFCITISCREASFSDALKEIPTYLKTISSTIGLVSRHLTKKFQGLEGMRHWMIKFWSNDVFLKEQVNSLRVSQGDTSHLREDGSQTGSGHLVWLGTQIFYHPPLLPIMS